MDLGTGTEAALLPERISALRERAAKDRHLRAMMNAVTKNGIEKVAQDHAAVVTLRDVFSQELPAPAVTNQMKSGRCWMFASLNLLRRAAAERLKVEEFELSANYLTFFEKLEKANGFLDDVLATLAEPLDGRLVMWLFRGPANDGGEWELFSNLVQKYGVAPKSAMPETHHSNDSIAMNRILNQKLREEALALRRAHASGAGPAVLAQIKDAMLEEIFRILVVLLGLPPERFEFEYRDKDKAFHRDPGITPRTFYERYVGLDLDAYAGVMNLPTSDKPYGRTYRTAYLPTVHGGTERPYLNIDAETMSSLALRQVLAGEGVYFSCDVVQMMDREAGILDDALYDLEGVLGVPFHLSKPDRLGYGGEIEGSHVMLLAGVHVVDGAPVRWKVENSWGEEHGKKGYFVMSDGWFRNYALGIVVRKEYLSADLRAAFEEPPTVLPPWDPMQYVASVR